MKVFILTFFAGIAGFLKFYLALLTLRIYITWFPNINIYTQPFLTLGKMTDLYLRIFRGLIPAIFSIDLSPILGFLFINFLIDFFSSVTDISFG
jgi:YggT family protein